MVGGVVGQATDSTILECYSDGVFYSSAAGNTIGGIVGYIDGTTTVQNCSNKSSISENEAVNGPGCIGGIVGQAVGTKNKTIDNCSNSGPVTGYGPGRVGGIVGNVEDTTIKDCSNRAKIRGYSYVGGIVGEATGNVTTPIQSCDNSDDVSSKLSEGNTVGGIAGKVTGIIIENSSNEGDVATHGGGSYSGGIVGEAVNAAVKACTNTGTLTGEESEDSGIKAGGVVGYATGTLTVQSCCSTGNVTAYGKGSHVGGVVGTARGGGTVQNCYVTGNITANAAGSNAGGVVGEGSCTIQYCYTTGSISSTTRGNKAGGVLGSTDMGTGDIKNCAVLNAAISSEGSVGVMRGYFGGTQSGSYAWDGIELPGDSVDIIDAADVAELHYNKRDKTLSVQFSTIFGSDNTAWTYTENGLPILAEVNPDEPQSSALPDYILNNVETYEISTAAQLLDFAAQVNGTGSYTDAAYDFAGDTVKLTENIDLSTVCGETVGEDGTSWTPIGTADHPFSGTFDGQEHNVTNLYIATETPEPAMGLFGVISAATVKNMNLGVHIQVGSGDVEVGGVAGKALGSTVQDCTVSGDISRGGASTVNDVGGIVGFLGSKSTVKDCSNSCAIESTSTLSANVGGIVGAAYDDTEKTISGCTNTGTISNKQMGGTAGGIVGTAECTNITECSNSGLMAGATKVGGVVGAVTGNSYILQACTNTADVTVAAGANGTFAGGIAGCVGGTYKGTTVKNCANTGAVSAVELSGCTIGGIVGYALADSIIESCISTGKVESGFTSGGSCKSGGVVGSIESGKVKNCYSTGAVIARGGGGAAGGVVGYARVTEVKYCYSVGAISASDPGGAAGGVVGSTTTYDNTISNCVTMNSSVYAHIVANALAASATVGVGNYYWNGAEVSTEMYGPTAANSQTTALRYNKKEGTLSAQFSTIFENDTAWTYTDNGLPTLKDVSGEQSSALPEYILEYQDTYEISTVEELLDFAAHVNGTGKYEGKQTAFFGKTILLTADIDLSTVCGADVGGEGGTSWVSIGTYQNPFSGTFDGQGHVISNLYSFDPYCAPSDTDDRTYRGFFGSISGATIKNLGLENVCVTTDTSNPVCVGRYLAGGVAGFVTGGSAIQKCYTTGKVDSKSAGGLVGMLRNGTIENCYSTASVSSRNKDASLGGLVGETNEGRIVSSYSTGNIVGCGIVGGSVTGSAGTNVSIQNCVALNPLIVVVSGGNVYAVSNLAEDSNYYRNDLILSNGETCEPQNATPLLPRDGFLYLENSRFTWPNFDTTVWTIPGEANALPYLTGTGYRPELPATPAAPGNITADKYIDTANSKDCIRLNWSPVKDADRYQIYRLAPGDKDWQELGKTAGAETTYTDEKSEVGVAYSYRVQALYQTVGGAQSEDFATILLAGPTISKLENVAEGISITWSAVEGATGYKVYHKAKVDSYPTLIKSINNAETLSTVDTTAVAGQAGLYMVTAMKDTLEGAYSTAAVVVRLAAPTITGVSNVASETKLKLSCSAVAGATYYRIYCQRPGETEYVLAKTVSADSLNNSIGYTDLLGSEILDVDKDLSFKVKVTAYENTYKSESAASEASEVTVLKAANVERAINTTQGILINWTKVPGATGYKLYRVSLEGEEKLIATITNGTTTQYMDKTAAAGMLYAYAAAALKGDQEGFTSGGGCTTVRLTTPVITEAKNVSNGVQVTWNKVIGAEKYTVECCNKDDPTDTRSWEITNGKLSVVDTEALPGVSYLYTVTASVHLDEPLPIDADSAPSEPFFHMGLGTPTLTGIANVSGGIQLNWTKVENATGYRIYRKAAGEEKYVSIKSVTGADTLTTVNSGVTSGVEYSYKVAALLDSTVGVQSAERSLMRLAAPVLTGLTNVGGGVQLNWTKVAGATGYRIYRMAAGDEKYISIKSVVGNDTLTTINSGVTAGVSYSYKVVALADKLEGAHSAARSVVRLTTPTLTAAVNATAGIQLNWTKVAGATGYRIYRKAADEASYKSIKSVAGNDVLTTINSGVTPGVIYSYKVVALSGTLEGTQSAAKGVRRLLAPTISGITATGTGLRLTWTQQTGSTAYAIYCKAPGESSYKLVRTVSGTLTSYVDTTAKAAGTYWYRIATGCNGVYSAQSIAKNGIVK